MTLTLAEATEALVWALGIVWACWGLLGQWPVAPDTEEGEP